MGDHTAFFYGTLLIPKILYRVIYGSANPEPWQTNLTTFRPGLLQNYQRRRVRYAQYPGIIPSPGSSVRGTICTGLTDGDMYRLDIFEGDEYTKVTVPAKLLKTDVGLTDVLPEGREEEYVDGEAQVSVYVWTAGEVLLEDREWDFEEFVRNKMRLWTGEEGEEDVDDGFEDVRRATEVQKRAEGKVNGDRTGESGGVVNGTQS